MQHFPTTKENTDLLHKKKHKNQTKNHKFSYLTHDYATFKAEWIKTSIRSKSLHNKKCELLPWTTKLQLELCHLRVYNYG